MTADPRYPTRWQWLYETRRNLGLSQTAMAREVRVQRSAYAGIELGHRAGTEAQLKLIGDYLGKTVTELDATRTPSPPPAARAA